MYIMSLSLKELSSTDRRKFALASNALTYGLRLDLSQVKVEGRLYIRATSVEGMSPRSNQLLMGGVFHSVIKALKVTVRCGVVRLRAARETSRVVGFNGAIK